MVTRKDRAVVSREERERRVLQLNDRLLEIEQRLIPTGLHRFGRPPEDVERHDLLRMIASFDRPEAGVRALTDLIAEGFGFAAYPTLMRESGGSAEILEQRRRVETAADTCVGMVIVNQGREAGRLKVRDHLASLECAVERSALEKVLKSLESVLAQLETNREIDSLMRALRGEYVEPGPGADIIQNPAILPTGRNTHAVNPYTVPSAPAVIRAEPLAAGLLERHKREAGRYPETIAMVLWGIDNIKTEGESVAQALWLLGAKPRRDALNRATDVEIVPLESLGRPRIDVVMTVSGIFRDLFGTTMGLLDTAVRKVAALDEPADQNFVRKHVEQQRAEGASFDEAVVRVFSNAAGNYGTNVNFMVMDSQWENAGELGDLFVTRKCFAYGRDSGGRSFDGRESRRLLENALARVEVTYQNIDTTEVGITDVDHYFEYLGGVTRAVEQRAGSRPVVYLSDTLSPDRKVRTLEETVRLEARTKTLNPKWFEAMLRHGFKGVAEIEHRVTNTFGWSATADAVDDWVYDEVAQTFVLDEQMLERLRTLNPHSARKMVSRLLEASGRGLWSADQSVLDRLQQAYGDLEDRLEGVGC
jgi:magnesium chelatase subunit H